MTTSNASAFAAAAMGALMLAVAVTMWIRAKREFAQLSKRRDELERLLRTWRAMTAVAPTSLTVMRSVEAQRYSRRWAYNVTRDG